MSAAPYVVPDLVEPVRGYRSWTVRVHPSGEPRLCSPLRRVVWEPGRAHAARCGAMVPGSPFDPPAPRRVPADHDAPGDGCECGVHAWSAEGAALLDAAGARGLRAVTGEVALWGDVVRHRRGLCGALAYPTRLRVHAATTDGLCFLASWETGQLRTAPADELAALLEEVYGVPVAVDPATDPLGPLPRHAPAARRIAPALLGAPAPEVERRAPRRTLRRRLASRLGGSG